MSTRYYDPTDRRNKWRWDVAHWLNKLPGTCWASLVSWALGNRRLLDLRNGDDVRVDSLCRRDAQMCGSCYCGQIVSKEAS